MSSIVGWQVFRFVSIAAYSAVYPDIIQAGTVVQRSEYVKSRVLLGPYLWKNEVGVSGTAMKPFRETDKIQRVVIITKIAIWAAN